MKLYLQKVEIKVSSDGKMSVPKAIVVDCMRLNENLKGLF